MALELPFSKKLAKQAAGGSSNELRKVLKSVSNQLSVTQDLVKNNQKRLDKALTAEQSVKLLEAVNNKSLEETKANILAGRKVSKKEAASFLEAMTTITSTLDNVGGTLETSLSSSLSNFKNILGQEGQDRSQILSSITDFLVAQKIDSTDSQELLNLQKNESLLAATSNVRLSEILDNIIKSNEDSEPIVATLADLNEKAGLDLLNSDKLAESLDKKSSTGSSFKSDFLSGGLGSDVKGGVLSFGLQQLGLGGLEGFITPAITAFGVGFAKLFKFDKVRKLLKPLTSFFGKKGLGSFGKLFGKGTLKKLPIVGAIFGFFDGLLNASGIAGVSEEDLTIGDRIGTAISSLLSGLTLGFLDAETLFPAVKGIIDGIGKFFESTVDFLGDLFSTETDFSGVVGVIKDVIDLFLGFKNLVNEGLSNIFSGKLFDFDFKEVAEGIKITVKEAVSGVFDSLLKFLAPAIAGATDLSKVVSKFVFDSVSGMFEFFFGGDGIFSLKTLKSVAKFVVESLPFGSLISEKLGLNKEVEVKPSGPKLTFEDFSNSIAPVKEKISPTALNKSIEADKKSSAAKVAKTSAVPTSVVQPAASSSTSPAPPSSVQDLSLGVMRLNLTQ